MPNSRELRILHGVLADAERMASLAGESVGRKIEPDPFSLTKNAAYLRRLSRNVSGAGGSLGITPEFSGARSASAGMSC
jgi:hypothetical protein